MKCFHAKVKCTLDGVCVVKLYPIFFNAPTEEVTTISVTPPPFGSAIKKWLNTQWKI